MSTSEPKSRVGRPGIGDRVEVRLPTDLLRRIDRAAVARGLKRSELIRIVLTAWEKREGEL